MSLNLIKIGDHEKKLENNDLPIDRIRLGALKLPKLKIFPGICYLLDLSFYHTNELRKSQMRFYYNSQVNFKVYYIL